MRIKNAALNLLVYFLYFFGSCVLVMLAEALIMKVIGNVVLLPYPVVTILRIVIYTAGVPAILAAAGYFEGYREASCPLGDTIVGGLLAALLHLIFAMLFKFEGFVAGAVRFTAGLVHNGWEITADTLVNRTPYSLFLLFFVVYSLLYVAALTIAKYFGAQKRVMDRAELRKNEPTTPSDPE
jgi:hypothetical protein